MKTVIVSPEIVGPHKNGGIGTFATNWAQMLRDDGNEVVVIYANEVNSPPLDWMHLYKDIEVISVLEDEPDYRHFNYEFFVRRAELVSRHIPEDADVIYFQDWLANGFHFMRQRKFRTKTKPICVTVTHSSHQWILEANKLFPTTRLDVELSFAERYQVENSDFIASPSRYMVDYIRKKGWQLPPENKIHVLGYPFTPSKQVSTPNSPSGIQFNRLIFFGRIETRKGVELFVDALSYLKQYDPNILKNIDEVALLGRMGVHRFGTPTQLVEALQQCIPHAAILIFDELDTYEAQNYLHANAANSLVVAPSLIDNFPYALIEASLIPGLNIIASSYGGQPEILGDKGQVQLFEPHIRPLAKKIEESLAQGPRNDHELGHYDWQDANQRWLEFHDIVCRSKTTSFQVNANLNEHPRVDVCIPYYNHGQYLPSALKSLSQQSTDQFNLYVVNDGSTDAHSREVFHKMSQAYQEKANWFFIDREENYGLSETRNHAASLGKADYLLFMDSDNIASPRMVERFAECISITDYACLTCNVFWFQGNDAPFLERQPGLLQKPVVFWSPLGDCVELGLFHDCWGDANFIIQRSVFEAIGKFAVEEPLDRYRTGEDWEILARLSFAGYKIDVIPEVLFFYRYLPDSLNRTANEYESITRALRVYADQLEKIGLHHLIPWIYQVYKGSQGNQVQQAHSLDASEIHLMYEHLKQDPAWIADNIPWSKAIQGMLRKISKKVMKNREAL